VECRVSADFLEGPRNLPSKDFLLAYFQRVPEGWLLDWDKLNEETFDIGREIIE
jgi:hypothetical protein